MSDWIERLNILLFCVDQMHAACLRCAGHPDVRTPNLDRLAARYERSHCENAAAPPRASRSSPGWTRASMER